MVLVRLLAGLLITVAPGCGGAAGVDRDRARAVVESRVESAG